ncbi:hypothetical protein RUND412_008190 [Rhizina undulata]
MAAFSLATNIAALISLIPPLLTVCTEGYALLSTPQNIGEDWTNLVWQRKIEQKRFADWEERIQLQDDRRSDFLGKACDGSKKYLLFVETLAKIVECFRLIDEYRVTYADEGFGAVKADSGVSTDARLSGSRRKRRELKF